MFEDLANARRLGYEGDDAHLATALRAQQRENLIDPGQQ